MRSAPRQERNGWCGCEQSANPFAGVRVRFSSRQTGEQVVEARVAGVLAGLDEVIRHTACVRWSL